MWLSMDWKGQVGDWDGAEMAGLMLGDAVPLSSGARGVMDRGRGNVDNFPFMHGV